MTRLYRFFDEPQTLRLLFDRLLFNPCENHGLFFLILGNLLPWAWFNDHVIRLILFKRGVWFLNRNQLTIIIIGERRFFYLPTGRASQNLDGPLVSVCHAPSVWIHESLEVYLVVFFLPYNLLCPFGLGQWVCITSCPPFLVLASRWKSLILLRGNAWQHLNAVLSFVSKQLNWLFICTTTYFRLWIVKYVGFLLTYVAKLRATSHGIMLMSQMILLFLFPSMLCTARFLSFEEVLLLSLWVFNRWQCCEAVLSGQPLIMRNPKRANL